MRRVLAPLAGLILFAVTACGGTAAESNSSGSSSDDSSTTGDGVANETVPQCPFTAEQVSELVGQEMHDDGHCLWRDKEGIAMVTITMSTSSSGALTYDYQRSNAGETFKRVTELQNVDKGYIAVKDIGAEIVVISKAGSYTMNLSSFDWDLDKYEQTSRAMLDKILH
ncbi:hypothetical protein [Micromonospora eburnea]|uniref:DUF3558 domain-containing protein n=1 Tax=Micromonospora eburnea TaxID=227316 RepID=A0A1C6V9X6_9ACTN|nr:hypothetical protein [Micromonospora eburnea]SCL63118.1 hypothetical protein GA0070604_4900 [Micromonospora eburnea]